MDEFLPYHSLACSHFENSNLQNFRESCGAYFVSIFGYSYQKSYPYVGVVGSLLYTPFFLLIDGIKSHYIYGIFYVILFYISLIYIFDFKKRALVVGMLYFPFVYSIIHDTGPAKAALISYILVLLLVKIILNNERKLFIIIMTVITGIAISLSIEDKPFFIYLLPQLFGMAILFWYASGVKWNIHQAYYLIILVVTIFGGILIVLYFTKYEDIPYIKILINSGVTKQGIIEEFKYFFKYTFVPAAFADRVFNINIFVALISFASWIPINIYILKSVFNENNVFYRYIILLNILILITFLVFRNTWSGHHFIYIHIPVIIYLMYLSSKSTKIYRIILYLLSFSVATNMMLLNRDLIESHSGWSRMEVIELIKDPKYSEKTINIRSWGLYSILTLFKQKNQVITWIDAGDSSAADVLIKREFNASSKSFIEICNECSQYQVIKFYPGAKVTLLSSSTDSWKAFEIER